MNSSRRSGRFKLNLPLLIGWLRPTLLTTIFFALLLILQALAFSSSVEMFLPGEAGVERRYSLGFGPWVGLVSISGNNTVSSERTIKLQWHWIIGTSVACYLLGQLWARRVMMICPHWRRDLRVLLSVMATVLGLSFTGSLLISKAYWGYYVARPELPPQLQALKRVLVLNFVRAEHSSGGWRTLVVDNTRSVQKEINRCQMDPYYCLDGRILVALKHAKTLPVSASPISNDLLSLLYPHIEATNMLLDGEPGYKYAKLLSGVVVEAEGPDGVRLLFIALRGQQVSNDHYPYYEFLFSWPVQNPEPRLLSGNRFFYDIAGIEGVEWWSVFLVGSLVGLALAIPITLGALRELAA